MYLIKWHQIIKHLLALIEIKKEVFLGEPVSPELVPFSRKSKEQASVIIIIHKPEKFSQRKNNLS